MRSKAFSVLAAAIAIGIVAGAVYYSMRAAPSESSEPASIPSQLPYPAFEAEVLEADFVVVVPFAAISQGGYVEEGMGKTPDYIYEVDLTRATTAMATADLELPGTSVEIVRSTTSRRPFEDLMGPDDQVILLINEVGGVYTAGAMALSSDGTIRGVDGFGDSAEVATIGTITGEGQDAFTSGLAEYSIAAKALHSDGDLSLPSAETASSMGTEILVAIRGDAWPIDPPAAMTAEEIWDAQDPLARNITPEDAPGPVIDARALVRIIIQINGFTSDHDGEIVVIRDAVGVLSAFDVGVGTHAATMWVDPALEMQIDLRDDYGDPAEATALAATSLVAWGVGVPDVPFAVELLVDLGAEGTDPVIVLGRAFADEDSFRNAWEDVAARLVGDGG